MKFSEFIARDQNVCLQDIIPMLQQIFVNKHNWNSDDTLQKVLESKKKYITENILIYNIKKGFIDGSLKYDLIIDEMGTPLIDFITNEPLMEINIKESYVNIKSLIKCIAKSENNVPHIPDDWFTIAGVENPNNKIAHGKGKLEPAIATELGTLRNEKLKWDASIRAAAEIGLLFFEGELPKPTTKDEFVKKFNSKVGGLPDTTVEMIYKALPSEYRHKSGKPKTAKSETAASIRTDDLNIAIKAAVFAGSMYETSDAKNVNRLAEMLKENDCQVPPATVMEKIVEYVKKI